MTDQRKQIGVGDIRLSSNEKKYLEKVIASNRLSYGPFTKDFEKRFANEHGCKYAIFLNSGTSALLVALAALKEVHKWNDGDEVIVPSATFIATSNIILQLNLKPIFVDSDADTYNIDASKIEQKITDKTRAIIPVHLFGMACDMDPILALADKHNLKIVEDSCETMFAEYKGKSVGSLGDVGCFSTYIAHFLVTGVGGICTTNNPNLAVIIRSAVNHGRDSIYLSIDDDKGKTKEELSEVIDKRFSFVRMGYSFRATELEAAIGLGQLDQKDEIIKARRENAQYYSENLFGLTDVLQLPHTPNDRDHNFMMYPIVMKNETKTEITNFLENASIETRDLPTVVNQPFYKDMYGEILSDYPVTKKMVESGFYIGSHQYLTEEEKAYVVGKFYEYFNRKH
ncbi:DegT/DnrJ/EryC1/StrS family aminotransferase [Patescibacteria group bacterium]